MVNKRDDEIQGLKSGKKVFLLTLVICVVVPLLGVVVALYMSNDLKGVSDVDEMKVEPLIWGERGAWEVMKVNPTEIVKKPGHRPPFEGRVRKNLDFEIGADELAVIEEVKGGEGMGIEGAEAELEEVGLGDGLFYAEYVAGRRLERSGDVEKGQERLERAFAWTEKVLRIRFKDAAGRPLRGVEVGLVSVICAQKRGGVLNEDVELVFANEKTDEKGYIYLPVYDTVLRFGEFPEQLGAGEVIKRGWGYEWFEVPGRVGDVGDAVVVGR
ncbi:hypothetical protein KS4_17940 [Poriferisphaera corsica]|uniref:Uncharacterized protein n=1 Tax=Poriferisphaera corsica TaxID=2528020 RepID=A0A517YU35_9BACT|nr:hypothetical protein [Poriferisphaera corsica]QDU33738.1 hypothetical protein KS4_17940 [Poriferisphaera corsica]